ncbi:hypothetical protein PtB15_6B602 [Puccinia triticina]|nr:hypothetical protein PtB15_6B602 [Puccinia triticina]
MPSMPFEKNVFNFHSGVASAGRNSGRRKHATAPSTSACSDGPPLPSCLDISLSAPSPGSGSSFAIWWLVWSGQGLLCSGALLHFSTPGTQESATSSSLPSSLFNVQWPKFNSPTPHPILQEHRPNPRARTVQTTADHSLNKTLDGVGVGAVNMYLVVFRDISFHFENLHKHINRVKEQIHSFSTDTGHVSPCTLQSPSLLMTAEILRETDMYTDWITYVLMDSIVDDFFLVLELIEAETDKMEEYLLADSLGLKMQESQGVGERQRHRQGQRGRVKEGGGGGGGSNSSETGGGSGGAAEQLKSEAMIERARMLNRITTNHRLVVSLAHLIAQKHQTVEALQKRMSVDGFVGPTGGGEGSGGRGVGPVNGDWALPGQTARGGGETDHIVGLSQALSFYDTLLLNAHLAYLGILRVGLHLAKQAQDFIIIRLYLITLIVLPMHTLHKALLHTAPQTAQHPMLQWITSPPGGFSINISP